MAKHPAADASPHGRPPTDDHFDLVRRFPLVPIRDDDHLTAAHAMIDELSIINGAAIRRPGRDLH